MMSSPQISPASRLPKSPRTEERSTAARIGWPGVLVALSFFLIPLTVYQKTQVLGALLQWSNMPEPPADQTPTTLDFQSAYELVYNEVIEDAKTSCDRGSDTKGAACFSRKKVDFSNYAHKSSGGLSDSDRNLIAGLYYEVDSVFEFGVGESTLIAAETNLPRYSGVDSSAEWVSMARSNAPHRFRFYFADIGPTGKWGKPEVDTLVKMALDYQIAPLRTERDPFDVYFVDGRWRVACAMASFLHALHSGGDMNKIRVIVHDYDARAKSYGIVESLATIEKRSEKAIVLKLKEGVSSADLFNVWKSYRF